MYFLSYPKQGLKIEGVDLHRVVLESGFQTPGGTHIPPGR